MPSELRQSFFKASQVPPTAGHGGIEKTLDRIRQVYYYPGTAKDVQELVKGCEVCTENKSLNNFDRLLIDKQMITERPFQRLYIDYVGPIPRTEA